MEKENNMKKEEKLFKYLIMFIAFSFLGAFVESMFGLISGGHVFFYWRSLYLVTSLKIPFIPFYGIIFLLLFQFQEYLNKKNVPFVYWGILNAFLILFYEFIFGVIGLLIFNKLIWDYSTHIFNFMGVISLSMFLLWIVGGYVFSLIYLLWKRKLKAY